MYNIIQIKNRFKNFIFFSTLLLSNNLLAQAPNPALVGYFHNWNDVSAPYVELDQIDSRYNIIDVAFALPKAGTDYNMQFVPDRVSKSTFISQIETLQSQGRKVLISVGGATAPISLDNAYERDTFISTMSEIINTYGFDGIDIDFESSSLYLSGGTISNPVDPKIINVIFAIKRIMANYYAANKHRLILTMSPETAFVQGGQSAYGGIWGAYLPVIDALRDSIEILHVQLYNTGTMYGIDGNIYAQGTADFIIAMTEAVIQGFNTAGGKFNGLPASKVAIGLPACTKAAGGGFTDTAVVKSALNYLMGKSAKPGTYTLKNGSGYPTLRGMMTWSINWDAVSSCGGSYDFAGNFQKIFKKQTGTVNNSEIDKALTIFPNPAKNYITITVNPSLLGTDIVISNCIGQPIKQQKIQALTTEIEIQNLPSGIYFIRSVMQNGLVYKFLKN